MSERPATVALAELPDDHPAWRLVGQWIAVRQLGSLERLHAIVVSDEAARTEVANDAARVVSGPLRTGSRLDVRAVGRIGVGEIGDLRVTLVGKIQGGDDVENRLSIARITEDRNGEWKIAALLSPEDRALFDDPRFQRFLAGSEPAALDDGAAPLDSAGGRVGGQ